MKTWTLQSLPSNFEYFSPLSQYLEMTAQQLIQRYTTYINPKG